MNPDKEWEVIKITYAFEKYSRKFLWKDQFHWKSYFTEEACLDAVRDLRKNSTILDYPSFGKGKEEEAKYPQITPIYYIYRFYYKRKMNNLNKIPDNIFITPREFREGKSGYILVPYVCKNKKTTINDITVWHSNKLINLWLKIKFFFWKPKSLKMFKKYANKPINQKYYGKLEIKNDEQAI